MSFGVYFYDVPKALGVNSIYGRVVPSDFIGVGGQIVAGSDAVAEPFCKLHIEVRW